MTIDLGTRTTCFLINAEVARMVTNRHTHRQTTVTILLMQRGSMKESSSSGQTETLALVEDSCSTFVRWYIIYVPKKCGARQKFSMCAILLRCPY